MQDDVADVQAANQLDCIIVRQTPQDVDARCILRRLLPAEAVRDRRSQCAVETFAAASSIGPDASPEQGRANQPTIGAATPRW